MSKKFPSTTAFVTRAILRLVALSSRSACEYRSAESRALLLLGCVHTYEMRSGGEGAPRIHLPREASFLVGVPEDGRFGTHHYPGSGFMTTQEVVAALSTHARIVRAAKAPATIKENSAAARSAHLQYLVQPTILHWEERATEWSGKPDRISVRLELIEVSSGATLDTTVLSGKSKWATLGGDHPQELLPEPLSGYANALFGP